jgi:hypothetical protein
MSKRKILAITADGLEHRRTTTKALTHFWRVLYDCRHGQKGDSGFASSEALARKAAAGALGFARSGQYDVVNERTEVVPVTVV